MSSRDEWIQFIISGFWFYNSARQDFPAMIDLDIPLIQAVYVKLFFVTPLSLSQKDKNRNNSAV